MYLWIWVTIAAALSQSLRTAQQKNLQPILGNFGASFVRFSYAIPVNSREGTNRFYSDETERFQFTVGGAF